MYSLNKKNQYTEKMGHILDCTSTMPISPPAACGDYACVDFCSKTFQFLKSTLNNLVNVKSS